MNIAHKLGIILFALVMGTTFIGCSGAEKKDEPVGRPPTLEDKRTPRKSTQDDLKNQGASEKPEQTPQSAPK